MNMRMLALEPDYTDVLIREGLFTRRFRINLNNHFVGGGTITGVRSALEESARWRMQRSLYIVRMRP